MKPRLDLPDDLVKAVKLWALKDNRTLKDAVAELLRKGLAAESETSARVIKPQIEKDPKTGLPLIECRKAAAREVSPKRAAEILLEQDVKWHEEAAWP